MLLEDYHADDVLICGSGTQALQLALTMAADGMANRTIALPAYGCYDLASAAVGADVRVCLYDVNPATLAPDPDSVRSAIAAGARTIVAAPLFGVPIDWDVLRTLVRSEGCLLIEDAAQGHGALWRGKPLGSWGDMSIISFGRGKGWTAGGGGALLTNGGSADARLVRPPSRTALRQTLLLLTQWALGRPALYGLPASVPALGLGRTVYREPQAPHRMSRFALSVLAVTRGAALAEAESRRANAAILAEHARAAGLITFDAPPHSVAGYLRLPVRLGTDAQSIVNQKHARALGVATAYPATLAELPALSPQLVPGRRRFAGAETLVRELVTFPTHSRLSRTDIVRLMELMDGLPVLQ